MPVIMHPQTESRDHGHDLIRQPKSVQGPRHDQNHVHHHVLLLINPLRNPDLNHLENQARKRHQDQDLDHYLALSLDRVLEVVDRDQFHTPDQSRVHHPDLYVVQEADSLEVPTVEVIDLDAVAVVVVVTGEGPDRHVVDEATALEELTEVLATIDVVALQDLQEDVLHRHGHDEDILLDRLQ
jgi:hypothetical protein